MVPRFSPSPGKIISIFTEVFDELKSFILSNRWVDRITLDSLKPTID